MYARGILFGQMKYELGDVSVVRCPELGLSAEIEFKTKGWVSGTYNSIGGTIRDDETGEALFELSGLWSEEMYVKDLRVSVLLTDIMSKPITQNRSRCATRLVNEKCSSTPQGRSLHVRASAQSRSRKKASLFAYGTRQHRLSRRRTTKSRPMRRPRSKRLKGTKLQGVKLKVGRGTPSSSGGSETGQVRMRRSSVTWSGSSTAKCEYLLHLQHGERAC